MRVLITGGYGFIGAWIVKNLLEQDIELAVYDLQEDNRRLSMILPHDQVQRVQYIHGDITDLERLTSVLDEGQFSHIIHLAGLQVPTCRANPLLGAKVNVLGTLSVFEAVKTLGTQIERIVYASSSAVFSSHDKYPAGSLRDDVILLPSTHYGVFKSCNEGNARIYYQDHGINSVGIRPWTVYGVGRDLGMTSEPTKAIKAALMGRPYHINFGGITDFQYVDDVAKAFTYSCTRNYKGAKSYNLRGHVVPMSTFVDTLHQVFPESKELVTHGDSQIAIAYDLDDSGIQTDLGPMPRTPLADGIRATLDGFRMLKQENRLDISDLESAAPPPVRVIDEV